MKKNPSINPEYTEEELELIEALEKGPIVRSKTEKEDMAKAKIAAENWSKEQEEIQLLLSLTRHDRYKIETLAKKEGIPYQTFISNIIHDYVEKHKD